MLAPVEYKLRSELQLSLGELGGKNTGDGEADDRIKDISRRILRPSRECVTILFHLIDTRIMLNLSEIVLVALHQQTSDMERGIFF